MTPVIYPMTPGFAAEVGNVDLSAPLAESEFSAIREAFWEFAVLVFPGQRLTQQQHVAFAKRFGEIETDTAQGRKVSQGRIGENFADVSNLDHQGKIWEKDSRQRMFQLCNQLWHTDSSFKRQPALASLLYARSIPPLGGHTEFADQRAAYDALTEDMKARLTGLVAEHSIFHSRRRVGFTDFNEEDYLRLPPVPQAMVRTIPQNGRKTLYLASHAGRVFGLPDGEGLALIDQLTEHITQRRFVYAHRWRVDDLVMWDNRCTMHRGTEFDDLRWERDMQRATIRDIANSCEQEGIPVPSAEG